MKQLSLFETPEPSVPEKGLAKSEAWQLYIDGASRNNPGKSGVGVVIYKDKDLYEKYGFYIGIKTNNQAEYYALLVGLFLIKQVMKPADMVTIISDSQLLIRQFKGEYRVKHPELKPLHALAQTLLVGIHYRVRHVMREENSEADEMANFGIDTMKRLPTSFSALLKSHDIT